MTKHYPSVTDNTGVSCDDIVRAGGRRYFCKRFGQSAQAIRFKNSSSKWNDFRQIACDMEAILRRKALHARSFVCSIDQLHRFDWF